VSDTGFIDALRYGSTLVVARFTVFTAGAPQGTVYNASVSTGQFTVDRNSNQRRSGQMTIEVTPTIPPPPLLPTSPTSLLAPFGNEIFIETGIAVAGNIVADIDGSVDLSAVTWVPLGLFAIATTQVDDTGVDLTCGLTLYDRSWTIAQRTLKNPYQFPSTVSGEFAAEIEALCNMVWNEQQGVQPLQFNIVPTAALVPVASYDQGSDPWQACMDMAAAVGYELFFDAKGIVTGKPIPDPMTTAVTWNFTDDQTAILGYGGTGSASLLGSPYSTPVEVSVDMTRDGIFNDIVIQGTGDTNLATYNGDGLEIESAPILAEAADNNPQSPTWVRGAMGDVPNFVSSSLVTGDGAQPMANNELSVALSSAWTITLSIPPNPTIDVDQVCTTTRPRVGLDNAKFVIDTVTQTFRYDDIVAITGRVVTAL
jgi:hypothetical protein